MSVLTAHEHARMARAIYLAGRIRNGCDPNPRVGCVIDADGKIVGEGFHRRAGGRHAEVVALDAAGERARGATAFVTLEPCNHQGLTGPCTQALIAAGVKRVVVAAVDPNPNVDGGGQAALQAAGIEVHSGLLSETAQRLNRGFEMRTRSGRPFVSSKIAASADGRVALPGSRRLWITSPASRDDVQQMRSRASAMLTGIGTILADNPRMNVRLAENVSWQQPWRVVLDSALRTPGDAAILGERCMIFCTEAAGIKRETALIDSGARVSRIAGNDKGLNLAAVMQQLCVLQINEVMVEAGPILNGALLDAGLLDEVVLYRAPAKLGREGRSMFEAPAIDDMASLPHFSQVGSRRIGDDWRLRYVAGSV
ncbi:MAG: bifunctional diaminohydroxyphosphoribosylaminopyrimidine deaminase/5-amino-6-(5-phosphoribosylamino)uracil reductase RibD [Gammaproteobacteria bacterium]|nr:bifunctional diaminohydroxyphosphoribosylaminopyrimidine deaminase/5-amino-6-(5-phosphoribosylamino)uracil reductase RibD [Gammaproteobacteria bacterium]NNF59959.1 bifunctional diaminohydroxyphosphoribosylaminopyrimidine deaminase/5-amino-6-(5-phosphoribosylamino)uracil reductase RibD [Gammaproteobacteria bacterium]NNM19677.1 bifunctional diaminohydroxyphosphoribosylaminopyrimidine deaminase/5-amino-6-(5-phosphoribosylamino)uracil reductase RibD [Gammaproteobacteria bacterium]